MISSRTTGKLLALVSTLALLATACASQGGGTSGSQGPSEAQPQKGGSLTWAAEQFPPHLQCERADNNLAWCSYMQTGTLLGAFDQTPDFKYVPELSGFVQPLAGEIAGARALFESIPWPVGYGIEIGMMIDSLRLVGLDALAQVDLGVRQNRHQSLRELTAMAYAVMVAAARRIHGHRMIESYGPGPLMIPSDEGFDFEVRKMIVEERPPLADLFEETYSAS